MANIQSLVIETTATAYESAVWTLRSWQVPGMLVYQFFLLDVSLVSQPALYAGFHLLHRTTLEEQVHAGPTHDDEARRHAGVDYPLNPLLAIGDSNQGETNGALDGDEGEAPRFLEDIEPHQ